MPSNGRNGSSGPASRTQNHPETDRFRLSSAFGRALVKRVRNDDVRHGLLARDTSILIAVSGGPDSVALLHILLSLREKMNLQLGIVHVNYWLRGEDSDADERLVREYAETYGIPRFVTRIRGACGKNEATLRDIRYRFFERIADREGYDVVATAHTEDDQAETVLIRLLRGSGPEGLAGIRPHRDRYIRPLLARSKAELFRFLKAEHLLFREDASNRDTDILRNRIRHELLPLLERDYRKGVRKVLARVALHLSESETRVPSLPSLVREDDLLTFSRKEFLALSASDRTIVARHLLTALSGTGYAPSAGLVGEVMKLIRSRKGKAGQLASGRLKIETRGDRVGMIRIR